MAKIIDLPDGTEAEFPDDMNDDAIAGVLQKQFPAPTKQPTTNTLGQEAKRQGGLLVRALASAAGSVGALPADAIGKAVNYVAGKEVIPNQSHALQQTLTRFGLPEPERGIEKFTQGIGETAPAFALPMSLGAQVGGNAILGATQARPGQEGQGAIEGTVAGMLPKTIGDSAKLLGKSAANVLGMTSGAGGESVKQAFKGAPGFVENMRGQVEPGTVVDAARQGVQNMRQQMYDNYAAAKGGWAGDTTRLPFDPIKAAADTAAAKFSFRGVPQPGVESVQQQVNSLLKAWEEQGMAQGVQDPRFFTVEGLDALKRHLQDLMPDFNNRTGRAYVTEVVNNVKNTITKQAPQYATAMKDYWARSNDLDELTKSLSLGDKATVDTALRKLQSLTRNNVSTNYGQRLKSAQVLADQGGQDVLPAVAGQSMNSWTPRGLQAAAASTGGIGALLMNPTALLAAPVFSPRAVGEVAHGVGSIANDPRVAAALRALRRSAPVVALQGTREDE